jgi:hypothetical protein
MSAPRTGTTHPATSRSPRSPRWGFGGRHRVRVGDELHLTRRRVQCPIFALLATRIFTPDSSRAPHNHSRWFATLILSGGYWESVWDDSADLSAWRVRHHSRFSVMVLRRDQAHRITRVEGKLRTFVVAGPWRGDFEFWTPDGPVGRRDYG